MMRISTGRGTRVAAPERERYGDYRESVVMHQGESAATNMAVGQQKGENTAVSAQNDVGGFLPDKYAL
jgi:hypothetical protein